MPDESSTEADVLELIAERLDDQYVGELQRYVIQNISFVFGAFKKGDRDQITQYAFDAVDRMAEVRIKLYDPELCAFLYSRQQGMHELFQACLHFFPDTDFEEPQHMADAA
ncbi:MAG: hypothetical protein O2904_03235 [bacterium]|nr:hypothetical protein [bacterium]